MKARIHVEGVSKAFALSEPGAGPVSLREALRAGRREVHTREIQALSNVSFDVNEGERIGVIGRNGAGKTTLLSLLAGVASASTGHIDISGDVHAMLTIGAVLRDEATGRENIFLDGAVHGKTREEVEAHVAEVIEFSELGEFIDRPVRTYSSGMKARLAFSMGAFINPDILIIDETLSVGDAFFSVKATRRMKEITAKGRIVIVVSHALGFIDEVCDRCLWFDQGKLVMDGPAREVTRAYSKAVEDADESELNAKFTAFENATKRPDAGALDLPCYTQEGRVVSASVRAFVPLAIDMVGTVDPKSINPDLRIRIMRVDGRLVLSKSMSQCGQGLPSCGSFESRLEFDPLILAAGLYRFEITLEDAHGPIDQAVRALEIIDEEGQYGGVPLLYYPPAIKATKLVEA